MLIDDVMRFFLSKISWYLFLSLLPMLCGFNVIGTLKAQNGGLGQEECFQRLIFSTTMLVWKLYKSLLCKLRFYAKHENLIKIMLCKKFNYIVLDTAGPSDPLLLPALLETLITGWRCVHLIVST